MGGVGSDEEAGEDDDGAEEASGPAEGGDEGLGGRVVGHVAEEHAEVELLTKGFYSALVYHHPSGEEREREGEIPVFSFGFW